ncbi:MAG: hypothetical protein ACE5K1_08030 [Acidiferrobacterales bacterium]
MKEKDQARHNLEQAVQILAVGQEDIKHRLQVAYIHHVKHVAADALPNNLRQVLTAIHKKMTDKKPFYEGQSAVEANVYWMKKKTAAAIAKQIWELHRAMERRP